MYRLPFRWMIPLLLLLCTGVISAAAAPQSSIAQLQQRLDTIDTQLAGLANYGLGSGIGAIGFRSINHPSPDHTEWVQIHFEHPVTLNEIILVPTIRRDSANGFQADGFPQQFRLLAGTSDSLAPVVIATYTNTPDFLPRIAPLVIPCDALTASWIRIEASKLSLRAFDQTYTLQFAEILAFSGAENVALHCPVTSSSAEHSHSHAWALAYAVDGFVPYLMDAAKGEQSVAYVTPPLPPQEPAQLTLDLQEEQPITAVHLHAVDQADTLPQAFAGDFGIPKRMRVEGATQADFSDARLLFELAPQSIYEMGSIMISHFPATCCRFVRFTAQQFNQNSLYGPSEPRLGFAEIEIYAGPRNVALHKSFTTNFDPASRFRQLTSLTDGHNMYGRILPIRDWLNQLALRHQLETERPQIEVLLKRRYLQQRQNLTLMSWLVALLCSGSIILILVGLIIKQRVIHHTRERIAADLHDELGANLHAIGLLGDLAQATIEAPEKHRKILGRMRALTERTGAAARYCTNMLESKGLYEDLVEDMKRTTHRIAADLDHAIQFRGETKLSCLSPRRRIDLFLFYKESLINIIRHSGASQVAALLSVDAGEIRLCITDNGHGLDGEVPASLKRRARLLGGQVSTSPTAPSGTTITLTLRARRPLSHLNPLTRTTKPL